jgi:hypothetical protein
LSMYPDYMAENVIHMSDNIMMHVDFNGPVAPYQPWNTLEQTDAPVPWTGGTAFMRSGCGLKTSTPYTFICLSGVASSTGKISRTGLTVTVSTQPVAAGCYYVPGLTTGPGGSRNDYLDLFFNVEMDTVATAQALTITPSDPLNPPSWNMGTAGVCQHGLSVSGFASGTTYTAVIGTTAKTLNGEYLQAPFTVNFVAP